jgi:hypothetical protein
MMMISVNGAIMNDIDVLRQFLEIPLDSADGIFSRFGEISGCDMRVGKQPQQRFLYVRGQRDEKVLLVAHADTVWDGDPDYQSHRVVSSNEEFHSKYGIGADDRAGCAILWLLKDLRHSLLVTDGEEHGRIGSKWLMSENKDIAKEINCDHQFVVQFRKPDTRSRIAMHLQILLHCAAKLLESISVSAIIRNIHIGNI